MPETPYVQVDVPTMQRNVEAMQSFCDSRGIALRPHVKTHKCVPVARAQLAAGAGGLTVATVGEAEVFADVLVELGGDVLVAYPVLVDPDRLRALATRVPVIIGVDSVAGLELAQRAGVAVSIEVDCGLRRSGVEPGGVEALATAAARRGVAVVGVFTFPGHGYATGGGRAAAARDEAAALRTAAVGLTVAGFEAPVCSGGSTPTAAHVDAAVVTELRPGVYVFGDAGQLALGACTPNDVALTVRATVVSTAVAGQFVIDAGAKVLGMDRPPFVVGHGLLPRWPVARLTRIWEHHGVVEVGDGPRPRVGEQVDVVPNHVCATVNLVHRLWTGSAWWPVAARGRNA